MKSISQIFCGTLLAALAWNGAAAADIKVNVTARVTSMSDAGNVLTGQVLPGQVFTGYYRYDSSTTPTYPAPNVGRYQMMGIMAGVKLARGSLVFESNVPNPFATVEVATNPAGMGADWLHLQYQSNKPLSNGATVNFVYFRFYDSSGRAPHTTALPTTAPVLQNYGERKITLAGALNSSSYIVELQIESVELVPSELIEVSPKAGTFLSQQRFDAALLLPLGSMVVSAQATSNGTPLPLSYPGTCTLAPPNSSGRPAILCADAHTALATVPNATQVEWSVTLSDGTVLNQTVEWKLLQ